MKKDIKSLTPDELSCEPEFLSEPKFRSAQVFEWLHKTGVSSFDEMTNISSRLRAQLSDRYFIAGCVIENKFVSKIDGTVKYLFRLFDREYIESVVMQYQYGFTICISTQVGCRMGCTFCASTLAGFQRNLLPSEMESQIHAAQQDLGIRISRVVLMGIGEPLDNFKHVLRFFDNIGNSAGLNISMRNITVSTCGIVHRIYDLMDCGLPVTLTVSLHASNDAVRSRTMPVNRRWGMDEMIAATKKYATVTGRRVSFEYTLIQGVNDSRQDAFELCRRLKGFSCHVNLIPVNDVKERGNKKSTGKTIRNFQSILKKGGINATIRRTLGSDINASCGQLRRLKKRGDQIENCCQDR